MNRDDIIRLAKEAGAFFDGDCSVYDMPEHCFERFAALVAAVEREACARICEELPVTFETAACEFGYEADEPTAENYAAAIRARG